MQWLDSLNASASSLDPTRARVELVGTHPFGAETVQRYQLGNGLTVLVLVDRSAPVASYFTWYKVGSRHEKPGKTGLAHFFEHLMFNETEGLKAGEFDRTLEENGAESNAGTWLDWTYYSESLPADRITLAVKLEAERMARLVLRDKQVASEREVVMNERRYRVDDDVEGAANELLYKTAFTVHPYHWPTIGWMQDIERYTPSDCEAFYRTYYAPNNATVVVVGDVDEPTLLGAIRDAYGPLPSSTIPVEALVVEPPQTSPRELEVKKPTATEKLLLAFRGPSLGDADHAPLTLLNEVLFGGRASRLYRALVIETEIASEVRGWVSAFAQPGLYETYVTAREGKTTRDLETVLARELTRAREALVTDDELARAKARLELSLLQSLETMSGKAEQIGFNETVLGDPSAGFTRLDAYRNATAADLQRVAQRYLVDASRTIIRVLPEPEGEDGSDDDDEATEAAS
jgi:zinc protease